MRGLNSLDQIDGARSIGDFNGQHFQACPRALQRVAAFVHQAGHGFADGREPLVLQDLFGAVLSCQKFGLVGVFNNRHIQIKQCIKRAASSQDLGYVGRVIDQAIYFQTQEQAAAQPREGRVGVNLI